MQKITEIYLQPKRYNPKICITISGSWIAILDNGLELPLCRDYEADNEIQAKDFAVALGIYILN